jgi:hypothetical protein
VFAAPTICRRAGAPSANWGGRRNLETRRLHFAVFAGGVGRPGELVGRRLHGDKEGNGSGRQTARQLSLHARRCGPTMSAVIT